MLSPFRSLCLSVCLSAALYIVAERDGPEFDIENTAEHCQVLESHGRISIVATFYPATLL